MKTLNFTLLTALCLALFTACGPGKEDATSAKLLEDSNRDRQIYSQFVGLYKGEVEPTNPTEDWFRKLKHEQNPRDKNFTSRMVPVEMLLRVEDIPNGTDANGRAIFRPQLIGYYERQDMDKGQFLYVRRPLTIAYREETNTLAMKNSDTPAVPNPGIWNVGISAQYSNGAITGDIYYSNRVIGILRVKRVQ